MANYQRKPLPVLAYQFNGQPQSDWPSWVRDYKQYGPMGEQSPSFQLGIMKVPTSNNSITVGNGMWLVLENYELKGDQPVGGTLQVYSGDDFAAFFDEVDAAA